ncbi:alpha/beta fold hydrolase [Bacilli bacterium]|uniref:alpha/beta hydrolase n=1 Tax=Oceanobacillus TaxID=182709 RepID=UPI000622912A|nr:alpha/beta fold hydrolase [Oceanobacillus caeni]KKE78243.1 carboxylesterase [Bacilli bacterium VT-13-104]PZD83095.1 alpha/beta fold hydrolase [Bacilli bacterium]MBU8792312.1 alpha/beta fold hydrolase [Oceanobacillus caeni]PZD83916.1 alpha/beta fold hydrolase [Bacilli bacterium]PZD85834.1 alpha/beta fold hydrolase [Bacilli bacterium]
MIGCLVIHGFTGGPYEVNPLVNFLKENTDWHIEVPTLPGHGRELDLKDTTYKEWIDAAEEVLQRMTERFKRIYLIGFSMGGMIAAYLAAKYTIEKLVLLAPARKYLSFKQIAHDIGEVVEDSVKGTLDENKLYTHYKNKLGTVPMKANIEFMKLVKFTKPYLHEVKAPVLIAQGRQDGMVPFKTLYDLDKELSSEEKELVLFESSKHLICLGEDKDTLNQMVYDFLLK